jgi:ABC-type nitrate/sulfonate/bicarbonate transport system substrate-binding protein
MLKVGLISKTFFNTPYWCAERQGLFKAAGLDVETAILDSGTKVTKGLRDGGLQFAIGPPDGVIHDVEAGGGLRIVAGNSGKLSHYVIAQPRFKTIEDLKGAVIGCLSVDEGTTFIFQEMAARHGLRYPGDYTLDPVGGAPTRWKLLQEGRIDAGLQSIPLSYIAEDAGFSNLAATFEYIPDYQFTTVNADRGWVRAHAAETTAFLGALLRATRWIFGHRDGAAAVAAGEMGIAPDYAKRAWYDFTGLGIMSIDMSVSVAGLAKVVSTMKLAGGLPASAGGDVAKYLDLTWLEAARAAAPRSS